MVASGRGVFYLQNLFFFFLMLPKGGWLFSPGNIFPPGNCKPYSQPALYTFHLQMAPDTPRTHLSTPAGWAAFRVLSLHLVGFACFLSPPLTNPGLGVCSPGTPTHTPIYWLIICSTNAPPLVRDPALDQNAHQRWGFPFCSPSPLIYSRIFVFMQVCTHDYLVFCHLHAVQYLIVCIVSF